MSKHEQNEHNLYPCCECGSSQVGVTEDYFTGNNSGEWFTFCVDCGDVSESVDTRDLAVINHNTKYCLQHGQEMGDGEDGNV